MNPHSRSALGRDCASRFARKRAPTRPLFAGFAFILAATLAHAGSFALIGDMPYSEREIEITRMIIEEIGRDDAIAFVVHDGDIKSGGDKCDNQTFLDRKADFDLSRHPFILIPGDNDWTDCRRASNGGYNPEERLAKLRELFYPTDETLGRNRMKVTRQGALQPQFAEYRENVRWEFEQTLIVGLNIPGSNNNWSNHGSNREFSARLKANTAWLGAAFARARAASLRAVMVVMQANPDFEGDEAKKNAKRPGYRDGFIEFRTQLAREAKAFGKPVVVVHGDTHSYRQDKPLKDETGQPVHNVTRLETFGSPGLGWVKAHVKPNNPEVFRFQAQRFAQRP